MASKTADLGGPVRYLDFGGDGPASGAPRAAPLVCVHGLGGSALNWMAVGPDLAGERRVLALDLRGFGRTPLGGHTSRIEANRALLDRFLAEVVGEPAVLMGNSMGGLLSVLVAARRPSSVRGLVLVDPALPHRGHRRFDLAVWAFFGALLVPGLAERTIGRRVRRLGPERLVRETLAVVCADPGRVPAEVVAAHIGLAHERLHTPGADRALGQAGRSLLRQLARCDYEPVYSAVRAPVLVVHGDRDRLVPIEFSRELARAHGWRMEVLPGAGHVPMMETPARFLPVVAGWLRELEAAAA